VNAIPRYAKAVAQPGQGDALATALLTAADGLADDPGCLLYLINREAGNPDAIWVTEVWRSQADLDASLRKIAGSEQVAAALALVKSWKTIELESLGGKGPGSAPAPGS
jgi:quinol monooxygenase YgiN